MKQFVYCVFDSKVAAYGTPFTTKNEPLAIRSFERACTDPASDLSLFPDDFHLYKIGEFDDDTGELSPNFPPVHLVGARAFNKHKE